MSLQQLLDEGRLEQRETTKQEILELLKTAARCLSDASVEQVSLDGRFNHAYDAALLLATVPLRCAGYRTRGEGHHQAVFSVLPEIMGEDMRPMAQYLQKCRTIRNRATYSRSGIVSKSEVAELIAKAEHLGKAVRRWLEDNYARYC